MELKQSVKPPQHTDFDGSGEVDLDLGEVNLEIEELESRVAFLTVEGGGGNPGCGCFSPPGRPCV